MKRLSTAILTAALLLSSCGFQLRGTVSLPPGAEPLYVEGATKGDPLAVALYNQLQISGVQLADEAEQAKHTLVLSDQRSDKRSTALGDGARTIEYLLLESASIQVFNAQGQAISAANHVTERRVITNDPNQIISADEEEKTLRKEMRLSLAQKIARLIQAINYSPANAQQQN